MTAPFLPPLDLLTPQRTITGMSAILVPFTADGGIDWDSFTAHLARTVLAGLTPAVNMDTGYVHLLGPATQTEVLDRTRDCMEGEPFVAGAFVGDQPGDPFNAAAYQRQIAQIQEYGGTPVIFQSHGLTQLAGPELIAAYRELARSCERFIAFELGKMFAPFGAIYELETFRELMQIPQCIGAKHSSLSRMLEWDRLRLRNAVRPEFHIFTGNDLAIDMVMYGSDYLLGLSTFAPDLFGLRDRFWAVGDPAFYELNDWLQYLGCFAFRAPVPAYKHSAAQFLKLRGWATSNRTHAESPERPGSDVAVLEEIARHLGVLESQVAG